MKDADAAKTKTKEEAKKEKKVEYGERGSRRRILMKIIVPKKTRGNMDANFIISNVEENYDEFK